GARHGRGEPRGDTHFGVGAGQLDLGQPEWAVEELVDLPHELAVGHAVAALVHAGAGGLRPQALELGGRDLLLVLRAREPGADFHRAREAGAPRARRAAPAPPPPPPPPGAPPQPRRLRAPAPRPARAHAGR